MSNTVVPAEPGWPADFLFEQFYSLYPDAIEQWKSKEWDIYFSGLKELSDRIELCSLILDKEEDEFPLKTAAWVAHAVARCGNSRHVRWGNILNNPQWIAISYGPNGEITGQWTTGGGFWEALFYHAGVQLNLGRADHKELADIIGGGNGWPGML